MAIDPATLFMLLVVMFIGGVVCGVSLMGLWCYREARDRNLAKVPYVEHDKFSGRSALTPEGTTNIERRLSGFAGVERVEICNDRPGFATVTLHLGREHEGQRQLGGLGRAVSLCTNEYGDYGVALRFALKRHNRRRVRRFVTLVKLWWLLVRKGHGLIVSFQTVLIYAKVRTNITEWEGSYGGHGSGL